jgi:hypothetical protein
MKTFKRLTTSDFPGVDSKKFDEWKQAVMKTRGIIYMILVVYLILNIKSYGETGYVIFDTPVVVFIGILLIGQQTIYATNRQMIYVIISLCVLIIFNIILFFKTGRYIGESMIVVIAFFWLINKSRKNNQLAMEMGIDSSAIKRASSQ